MSIKLLADTLLDCLRANNLHIIEDLLTDPLAAQALDYNDGLVFHLACDKKNIGFARAAVPHTLPKYMGKELTYSIACGNTELFEILIGSQAAIFDHIHPNTLHLLAQRSLDVQKMPYPQHNVERDMLVVLLNAAPEHLVHQQIQQMHISKASVDVVCLVEDLVAQRQKDLLEQKIEGHGQVGRARKI